MTTAITIIERLHEHRRWANEKLLDASVALSREQLDRSFDIGQGSVWRSLLHMYAAEYVWLEVVSGDPEALCPGDVRGQLPGNQLGEGGIQSFAELRERWTALESRWQTYLAEIASTGAEAAVLDGMVERRGSSIRGGQPYFVRRSDALLHVCLHAHYTLTQVVNMLRQLGVEHLPDRMLIQFALQSD